MAILNESVVLNNGVKMPWLGFGTFKVENGNTVIDAVKEALKIGYRHIDTAAAYGNEEGVGRAIRESGIPREEIFLVSKVWNSEHGYEKTIKAFENTISRLSTDYLDLYLMHWPKHLNDETWKAMEKLYKDGKIRAIGVSNFKVHHLEDLMKNWEIIPAVNQVEFQPLLQQKDTQEFCEKLNIRLEAWSPLMQGKIFDIPLLKELSQKYDKTIAQITLRWDLQKGVVTIPKSVTPARILENSNIFDFEISAEDMEAIAKLDANFRVGSDPDKITF